MKNKLIIFVQIILIIIIIISAIEIIKWFIYNNQSKKILDDLSSSVTITPQNENVENLNEEIKTEKAKYNVDFSNLKIRNKEAVAWIKVNGTSIEYPIVQTNNNNFYLTHSFDKSYNSAGWVFIDYRNKLDGTDKNIIIYGHNRRDGSMFGTQKNTLTPEWYNNKENLEISFITEKENLKYQVFSVYEIPAEEYYIQTEFTNQNFGKFIQTLKQRSIKDFGIEVYETDQIITLSTCGVSNKNRVVLHAKKI
ncbi:MAG: class B sortase [Clostridia bacterium]|nr:class B sortase [Clostridia bacterium]